MHGGRGGCMVVGVGGEKAQSVDSTAIKEGVLVSFLRLTVLVYETSLHY